MKPTLFFLIMFFELANHLAAQTMPPLTGNFSRYHSLYRGKNLYFQNPFTGDMKTFCTKEVWVNGKQVLVNPQQSAFEIDLSMFKADEDTVEVIVFQHSDCKVKLLNPYTGRSSPFSFKEFEVKEDSLFVKFGWKSKKKFQGKVMVERFENNSWKKLLTIPDNLVFPDTTISTSVEHHSELNKYRIKVHMENGEVFYSRVVEYKSKVPKITYTIDELQNKISFNREAPYELLDDRGIIIQSGKKQVIDLSDLNMGAYYLNVDNMTYAFVKKEKGLRRKRKFLW